MSEEKEPIMISVPLKDWEELVERDRILSRLEAAGVDNWDWYHLAFQDDEDKDDE